jgi:hypothetical protein
MGRWRGRERLLGGRVGDRGKVVVTDIRAREGHLALISV